MGTPSRDVLRIVGTPSRAPAKPWVRMLALFLALVVVAIMATFVVGAALASPSSSHAASSEPREV